MRAGSRFRRYWFFAFRLPSFRLRHVFATPSDRLRDRACKAPGLSNLRSDSPLDSSHVGSSYLDRVGASDDSSTSGSLGVSAVSSRKWCRNKSVVAHRLIRARTDWSSAKCFCSASGIHTCRSGVQRVVVSGREEAELFLEQLPLDPRDYAEKELMTLPREMTLPAIRKRFDCGRWDHTDLLWLYGRAEQYAEMLAALEDALPQLESAGLLDLHWKAIKVVRKAKGE